MTSDSLPEKVTVRYGSCELKRFYVPDDKGGLSCYGYRIDRDINGEEIGRTEPSFLSRLYFD